MGRLRLRLPLVRRDLLFSGALLLADIVCFTLLYLYCLDWRSGLFGFYPGRSGFSGLALGSSLGALLFGLLAIGGHKSRTDMVSLRFATEYCLTCATALIVSLFLLYVVVNPEFSRSRAALLAAYVAFVPLSLAYRRIFSSGQRQARARKAILVLGAGHGPIDFYKQYAASGMEHNVRFFALHHHGAARPVAGAGSPPVEDWEALDLEAALPSVECIVVAEDPKRLPEALIRKLVEVHFGAVPVMTLEAFYESYWQRIPVTALGPWWALEQDFRLARNSPYRFFKRLFDILASATGLALTAPLFLLLSPLIRLESRGPAFFRQLRIKQGERPFCLYKFRTMHHRPGRHEDDLYTHEHDPRVTRLGFWLRKLRLDELPQLWNVLRGDMSLIGPRAEWVRCVEAYQHQIPGYQFRHLVKPGVTGWAQVNYPYGESVRDTVEKLQYDLYYIKHYSLFLDVAIVLKTFYVMLSFRGK